VGELTLPSAGQIYLCACVLIYSVERVEPCRTLIEIAWQETPRGNHTLVSSPHRVAHAQAGACSGRRATKSLRRQYRAVCRRSAV